MHAFYDVEATGPIPVLHACICQTLMIDIHPLGHWPKIYYVSWSAALGVADSQRPEIKVSKATIELEITLNSIASKPRVARTNG